MSGDLDAFLKGGNPEDGNPAPESEAPRPAPEAAPAKDAPAKDTAPVKDKAPPTPEPDDDVDPGEAMPGQPAVPRRALEDERQKRQNWVERAARAEAERDAALKRLEEASKPPPAPPPTFEPIDPARDPEGYTRRVRGVVLNERLNTSEMMALDKHGKEVVDAETAYFQKRAESDPRLWNELYSKPHPYAWMIENNQTAKLHDEIGTDPAAYRARVVAEERAKWESERGNGAQPSPVAGMPPSLANARSSAPRSSNGFAGPLSLEDIFTRPKRK
jgi:hypothetical protein